MFSLNGLGFIFVFVVMVFSSLRIPSAEALPDF
jgi:hypothetical protein